MDDLKWKAKQMVRKMLPLTLVAVLLYGSYSLYRKGLFRHGLGPAVGSVLHKLPYFGSRFRHYGVPSAESKSFAYVPSRPATRRRSRGGRRHKSRRHGHHRRHRR